MRRAALLTFCFVLAATASADDAPGLPAPEVPERERPAATIATTNPQARAFAKRLLAGLEEKGLVTPRLVDAQQMERREGTVLTVLLANPRYDDLSVQLHTFDGPDGPARAMAFASGERLRDQLDRAATRQSLVEVRGGRVLTVADPGRLFDRRRDAAPDSPYPGFDFTEDVARAAWDAVEQPAALMPPTSWRAVVAGPGDAVVSATSRKDLAPGTRELLRSSGLTPGKSAEGGARTFSPPAPSPFAAWLVERADREQRQPEPSRAQGPGIVDAVPGAR
jgi:hypothetical protein